MKKEYITPEVKVVEILSENLLTESGIELPGEDFDE